MKINVILKQAYKVLCVLEASLNSFISVAEASGIALSDSLKNIVNTVITGTSAVKAALEKVMSFLGIETASISAMSAEDLDKEIGILNEMVGKD